MSCIMETIRDGDDYVSRSTGNLVERERESTLCEWLWL